MTQGTAKGLYNSSATRIRPFFEALQAIDKSGESWLPNLLRICRSLEAVPNEIMQRPGKIQRIVFETETQGEQSIGPPQAFLKWLLENPERMVWPKGKAGEFGTETRELRLALMGRAERGDPEQRRRAVIARGLNELATLGASRSAKKWWAFEGPTKVDCYIETEKLCLFIEGKRTESLSPATAWFPHRNQFVRNLECAREHAAGRVFGCILISEVRISVSDAQIAAGLPHFTPLEREKLMRHYLGNFTWEEACKAAGVNCASLPSVRPQ